MADAFRFASALFLSSLLVGAATAEQADAESAARGLFDISTEQGREIAKAGVALDCAAIASRFDSEEEAHLLAFGFDAMREALAALREAAGHEGPLEGPFEELREAAAYMAGRQLGESYQQARQSYMESSEMDLERFHRGLFRDRNCAVIGL